MPVATLTSRERVDRAMTRQDHDRVPRHESFWSDTIRRWQGEGLAGDQAQVLGLLGTDFHGLCWSWPAPFDEWVTLSEDDETRIQRDNQGKTVRHWKHRMGTPEHIDFGCKTRDDWEKVYKPALHRGRLFIDPAHARREAAVADALGRWTYVAGVEGFEVTRALVGDETALIAMAEDPDWIVDISRTYTDLILRDYQAVLDAGVRVDGLWCYGDMAYNHATMCSPAMYRELLWPDHVRQVEFAHRNGMKFIYHTDGDINGVMDLYVEAGFDCLQPLEVKANVDVRRLVPKYGDRLSFFGNVDVMVMATNDREKIEAEVAAKLAAGKARRGYIYHSDHSVPPSVSWDTYRFIMDAVDRHGRYA